MIEITTEDVISELSTDDDTALIDLTTQVADVDAFCSECGQQTQHFKTAKDGVNDILRSLIRQGDVEQTVFKNYRLTEQHD